MISGFGSAYELESEEVSIGPRLRPDDFRMFDRLMVGRRPNAQRANLADRNPHVDRHPEATDARVDGEPSPAHRAEQVDFGIERPALRTTTRAAVDRDVSTARRKDGRESVRYGSQDIAECTEAGVV